MFLKALLSVLGEVVARFIQDFIKEKQRDQTNRDLGRVAAENERLGETVRAHQRAKEIRDETSNSPIADVIDGMRDDTGPVNKKR